MSKNESEIIENVFLIILDFRLFSSYLYIRARMKSEYTQACRPACVYIFLIPFIIILPLHSHPHIIYLSINSLVVNNSLTLCLQINLTKTIYI